MMEAKVYFLMAVVSVTSIVMLAFIGYLFFRLRKDFKAEEGRPWEGSIPETSESMKCPRCGREMEIGFTASPRGIAWRPTGEKPLGFFVSPARLLANTFNLGFSARENRAWRCRPCRMVVVDHGTLIRH